MNRIRVASPCLVVAFLFAPLPAHAQSIASRMAALEARVAKLEGSITATDLAGTYRAAAHAIDLDGQDQSAGGSATVTIFAYGGTLTLNANGNGTIVTGGGTSGAIQLVEGTPWTDSAQLFPADPPTAITWTYANGILNITDGTVNLDLDLIVGAGGRVLIWAGIGDDNEASIIIATRLQ